MDNPAAGPGHGDTAIAAGCVTLRHLPFHHIVASLTPVRLCCGADAAAVVLKKLSEIIESFYHADLLKMMRDDSCHYGLTVKCVSRAGWCGISSQNNLFRGGLTVRMWGVPRPGQAL